MHFGKLNLDAKRWRWINEQITNLAHDSVVFFDNVCTSRICIYTFYFSNWKFIVSFFIWVLVILPVNVKSFIFWENFISDKKCFLFLLELVPHFCILQLVLSLSHKTLSLLSSFISYRFTNGEIELFFIFNNTNSS